MNFSKFRDTVILILCLYISASAYSGSSENLIFEKDKQDEIVYIKNDIEISEPTLVLDLTIGTDDIEGPVFSYPIDMCEDIKGYIFVLDHRENMIYKLSSEGEVIKEIGRQGQGPGEFSGAYALGLFSDGSLLVSDFGNKRFQIFDNNGEFQKILKPECRSYRFIINQEDEIFNSYTTPHIDKSEYPLIIKYDRNFDKISTIGVEKQCDHFMLTGIANDVDFAINSQGELWVCFINQNKINIYHENQLVKQITRKINFEPAPLSFESKQKDGITFGRSNPDKISYSISIDRNDNVYVLTNYYTQQGLKQDKPFTRILEIFNSEGSQVKSIPILKIKPSHMVIGQSNKIYLIDRESALIYRYKAVM